MSDSLRDRKKRERKNAILDACADALTNRDIDDISMDEIAKLVDVSRATIFNYFASKTEMVYAIADREIDAIEHFIEARNADTKASPVETMLEAIYRLVAVSFAESRAAWRILKVVLADPSVQDSPMRRMQHLIVELIAAAKKRGELRTHLDSESCARAVLGTYLAELYYNAGLAAGGIRISRSEFDAVADQLVMRWTDGDA